MPIEFKPILTVGYSATVCGFSSTNSINIGELVAKYLTATQILVWLGICVTVLANKVSLEGCKAFLRGKLEKFIEKWLAPAAGATQASTTTTTTTTGTEIVGNTNRPALTGEVMQNPAEPRALRPTYKDAKNGSNLVILYPEIEIIHPNDTRPPYERRPGPVVRLPHPYRSDEKYPRHLLPTHEYGRRLDPKEWTYGERDPITGMYMIMQHSGRFLDETEALRRWREKRWAEDRGKRRKHSLLSPETLEKLKSSAASSDERSTTLPAEPAQLDCRPSGEEDVMGKDNEVSSTSSKGSVRKKHRRGKGGGKARNTKKPKDREAEKEVSSENNDWVRVSDDEISQC